MIDIQQIPDRIWARVMPEPNSGCWLWVGGQNGDGYGFLWTGEKRARAHRWFYEQLRGEIPEGLQIDHLCRIRCCVNPDHLEPVTNAENVQRGYDARGLKTHCKRAHPFNEENTLVGHKRSLNGKIYPQRRCRICMEISRKAWRSRNARRRV